MREITKELSKILNANRQIGSSANRISKLANNDAEHIIDAIKEYIKNNASHIDLNNCSEFEAGYHEACKGMLQAIKTAPLRELLVNEER